MCCIGMCMGLSNVPDTHGARNRLPHSTLFTYRQTVTDIMMKLYQFVDIRIARSNKWTDILFTLYSRQTIVRAFISGGSSVFETRF